MLNQITNDICRTQKTPIIRFENDASAEYDQLIFPLACLQPGSAVVRHAWGRHYHPCQHPLLHEILSENSLMASLITTMQAPQRNPSLVPDKGAASVLPLDSHLWSYFCTLWIGLSPTNSLLLSWQQYKNRHSRLIHAFDEKRQRPQTDTAQAKNPEKCTQLQSTVQSAKLTCYFPSGPPEVSANNNSTQQQHKSLA